MHNTAEVNKWLLVKWYLWDECTVIKKSSKYLVKSYVDNNACCITHGRIMNRNLCDNYIFRTYCSCNFSERYKFPLIVWRVTPFICWIIWPRTSTILFRSISVFLLVNFFTKSLEVIGFRHRYLRTSSSDIVLVDSVRCFLEGGLEPSPAWELLGAWSDSLSLLWALLGDDFFVFSSFLAAVSKCDKQVSPRTYCTSGIFHIYFFHRRNIRTFNFCHLMKN